LGRRSLLWCSAKGKADFSYIVTSVSDDASSFEEVPAEAIWYIELDRNNSFGDSSQSPLLVPNKLSRQRPQISREVSNSPTIISALSDPLPTNHPLSEAADGFLRVLDDSVKSRAQAFSRAINGAGSSSQKANVAVLFSGGIDSTTIAYLADRYGFIL